MPNEYPKGPRAFPSSTLASPALLEDLSGAGVDFSTDVGTGRVPRWPGVVVRATSNADVSRVLEVASKHRVAVTAQGGRSSVVGGAVAPEGGIALDLTGLNRVLDIDTVSGTVSVEAGVFGPDLERAVAAEGFTVG